MHDQTLAGMECLPGTTTTTTPLLFHTYAGFHSPTTVKSRPTLIVSVSKTNERVHPTRTPLEPPHQQEIPTMKPIASPGSRKRSSDHLSFLEKIFDMLDKAIIKFIDPPLHLSVDPTYILTDNFAPVNELNPTDCKVVHGSIPACLDGAYIRNGPNPQFLPGGPHHYLDGDGMVHCIRISQGRASFCCRYVKTNKYIFEHKVRSFVIPNVIGGMQHLGPFVARAALFTARAFYEHFDISKGIGVANTNLAFFGGRLYALCESDLPYEIKVEDDGDIVTVGHQDFNGELSMNMTAHPKIDPVNKEVFAFRYWAEHPYLTYFRFDANGNKQPDVPIFSMKTPSLTHDLGITQKYAVIFDIQLGANPMNLIRGQSLVSADLDKVPRIGVLPRYAKDESDMKWFDVPGLNILHAVNAWDETDEDGNDTVVLVAPNILSLEHFLDRIDLIHGSMEKVTIHLGTGVVSRHTMSSDNLELPVINPAFVGQKNKYVYAAVYEKTLAKSKMIKAAGVVKLDISVSAEEDDPHKHTVATRKYGKNCFGGEPFFVARDPENRNSEEDDGYVVCYVHNESSGETSFLVMDAQSPTLEVVATVKLPQRVPYGLHGIFIREN